MMKKITMIAVTVVLLGIPPAFLIRSALTGKPVSVLFFGVFLLLFLFGIYFLVKLVKLMREKS